MKRKPDLVIGPLHNPYMLRWNLLNWRGWQLALHKIVRSDDDRALHDHSADNLSIIIKGCYVELPGEWGHGTLHVAPAVIFRKAEKPHRLVIGHGAVVWTLWLRWPPRREWGFHCPKGWRHWRDYVAERGEYYKEGVSTVGRGCDD